jgi:endonuclease/exonuclease/phosphatase family metal-dependent hydrolase
VSQPSFQPVRSNGLAGFYYPRSSSLSDSGRFFSGKLLKEESARQLITFSNNLKERAKSHNMNLLSVIGGDFNSDPTSDNWAEDKTLNILIDEGFKWTGEKTAQEDRISWLSDGRYPGACFDHIMVSVPERFEVSDSVTLKTTRDISDHRAVVVVIEELEN